MIEEELKAGRLPAVVATSSLELGIDMGAVDLVVQVESPPSVASGLQRIGRAGHQVGRGQPRRDAARSTAATSSSAPSSPSGCATAAIEALRYPRNPLDVLAQQVVAMVAMEPWQVDELGDLRPPRGAVRRAARPARSTPTLDMLSGRYPVRRLRRAAAAADLGPRRRHLTARPGAQRLAVTSGGTIPDRGLFGVFLVGEKASRVGELDEEMVYESRVGDVFLLGSSSWRIEDITHDRVLVTPAPGSRAGCRSGTATRLGRPLELGRALGAFVREVGRATPDKAAGARRRGRPRRVGRATTCSPTSQEQREATGQLPDDRTIVVERFRDELGDWRLCVHSPFGAQVHSPVGAGARRPAAGADRRRRAGDALRRRHRAAAAGGRRAAGRRRGGLRPRRGRAAGAGRGRRAARCSPSRFRECAARALLLPERDPTRRTPLWQQRQRSAQLLSVASQFGSFPMILETMRECLQDVFDVPGLSELMRDIRPRTVRRGRGRDAGAVAVRPVAAVRLRRRVHVRGRRTARRAPGAGARASTARCSPSCSGQAELRELLDAEALAEVEARAAAAGAGPAARATLEGAADLLRVARRPDHRGGAGRAAPQPAWLAELEEAGRALRVRIAGEERWVAVEDAGRLRDALGVPPPVGVPEAFLEPVGDPLGDLVVPLRPHPRARSCPRTSPRRFGLGVAVVDRRAAAARRGRAGGHRRVPSRRDRRRVVSTRGAAHAAAPVAGQAAQGGRAGADRRRSPASCPPGRRCGPSARRGLDGVLRAVEQLQGALVPASALETPGAAAAGRRTTPPPCWTSCRRPARCCGRAREACPAATAG